MDDLIIEQSPIDCISAIDGAIQKLKDGDAGAHFEDDVIQAARLLLQNDKAAFQRKRLELKTAHKMASITEWLALVKQSDTEAEASGKAGEVIELIQDCATLFHNSSRDCYAGFKKDGHVENWSINSTGFTEWLSFKTYTELNYSLSDAALKTALTTIKGIAIHDGQEQEVFMRCARYCDGYLIDLANEQWSVVEVTATGWRLLDESPIRFIRSNTETALPMPGKSNIDLLWRYVNADAVDKDLILSFMLDTWRPDTPYPLLFITGEQGSGKSNTHSHIRQITDPNSIPLRTAPKGVEDLFVCAATNHQASFENMSNLSPVFQDALCTIATGGGFAKRRLYSDADESVIEVKRPVIMNGIADAVTRPDLIDRMVHITAPMLADVMEEQVITANFERDRSAIFTGLLDLFSQALARLPGINLTAKPRMIDFVKLGEAVSRALDKPAGTFTECYLLNRAESLARSIDSSPAAVAIQEFIQAQYQLSWTGTAKALKAALDENYKPDGDAWPRSPKGLTEALKRMAPALRGVGVHIRFLGHKRDGSHESVELIEI